MANMEKNNQSTQESKTTNANIVYSKKEDKNSFIMKFLVFLGVLIFFFILVYLMYYFFVAKSDIQTNMSTDKKLEYVMIEGVEELVTTQKYVSDLNYSMRYDTNYFKVFKYKHQDIYKNLKDERILVVVEKSSAPSNCVQTSLNNEFNNCYIKIDDYTELHYISKSTDVYKITVKTPGIFEYDEGIKTRINNMISTFAISTNTKI